MWISVTKKTRSCVVKSITSILGFTPQHHCSSIGFFISLTPLFAGSTPETFGFEPGWLNNPDVVFLHLL